MKEEISEELYKKIHASMPIPCVDVVVIKNREALLCHRTNKPALDTWWFPGGRVHKNETLKEAAERKVKEETGLAVSIVTQLGLEETMFPDGPFGGPTHTINVLFLAEALGSLDSLATDTHHDDLKWFSEDEPTLLPYVKKYIRLANSYYEKRL